jgi:hypothetical protein
VLNSLPRAAVLCAALVASAGFFLKQAHPGSSTSAGVLRAPDDLSARELLARGAPGTYIGDMLLDRDSLLERWPERLNRPVRVWIQPVPNNVQGHAAAASIARSAFEEWAAVGIPVRFQYVSRAGDAEVRLRWVNQLSKRTGSTSWRADRTGWMRGADVTLAMRASNGRLLDGRSIRAIALHEVGHLLGLNHSGGAHDIMAPVVSARDLSDADRATAVLLYSLPPGRLR